MKHRKAGSNLFSIFILGILFFIFGFVTWLNGILIPYLKIACQLNNFQSLLVAFAFYISYFVMALPSSRVLQKTGFKKGMMLGLVIMAMGALIFIPAANFRVYYLFLTGLFIIGTGLSILQTAVNPYITIVGPIESAAKRISIMGVCNKVAGVLAPIVMGSIILADADTLVQEIEILKGIELDLRLNELASRVVIPYTLMASMLMLMVVIIRFSPLPEIEGENTNTNDERTVEVRKNIFQFSHLILGVVAMFFYVGVEVIAGDTIGNYGQSQGIPLSESKKFTSYTLTAMVIGYFIGIFTIPRFVSQSKALSISAISGIFFTLLAIYTTGYVSVLFIALLGLSNALVWPAIWPLAISNLGRFTKTGSALLIMAIAGGAILPLIYGKLADMENIGSQSAYWMLIPAYLFILFYAVKGHKQ
jgi:MFS transporter, FHS family, L-fucose permease